MFPDDTVMQNAERTEPHRGEIEAYFAGRRREFSGPFDLRAVGGFNRRVLDHLAQLPYGQLTTYGELAAAVGSPGAARAVGAAVGANPIPIAIPCHRVLAANGLGGFSGGGVGNKRALLTLEGAAPPELF